MPPLTQQQTNSIDKALDYLDSLVDRATSQGIPEPNKVDEIKAMVANLRQLLHDGKIDWESDSIHRKAKTDRNGIHLNPDFGNDYRNDYEIPDDWNLDDPVNGYHDSFWKLLEILFHEKYHYENHSGIFGAFFALFVDVSYATVGNLIEWLTPGPRKIRRKYKGREHQAYSYTASLLFWIDSMMLWLWLNEDGQGIDAYSRHSKALDDARGRQEPYDFK